MNTNETMNNILNRRSMRAFKGELPPMEQMQDILKAAEWAPSAMNLQECHITLVTKSEAITALYRAANDCLDSDTKERLKARFAAGSEINIFYNAPAVFIISADNPDEHYTKIDTGIVAQNICIAAKSFNIDTCIVGLAMELFKVNPEHEALKSLGIPAGHSPIIAIAAGYGCMNMPAPERKENRTNIV